MTNIERNKQLIAQIFAGKADRPAILYRPLMVPLREVGDFTLSGEPVKKWVPWVVENYRRQVESLERHGDDSVPVAKLATGTQIFANAFGCDVHYPPDSNPCAMPLAHDSADAEKVEVPDIWKTPCLYRVFELGHAVLRELGPEAALGPCDLQTGFDIAGLIWDKNDLFCAMALEPEAVRCLADKCALLLKTFLGELRREFPTMSPCHYPGHWVPPELGPWVSCDEVGSMSPEMFEEFCLPELNDLSEAFGGVAMHCCADAEHQFPGFNRVENFYAFNRVQSKRGYLPLLDHFTGPDAPVHCLGTLPVETVEALVTGAPAGTRFVLQHMGDKDDAVAAEWLARCREIAEMVPQ